MGPLCPLEFFSGRCQSTIIPLKLGLEETNAFDNKLVINIVIHNRTVESYSLLSLFSSWKLSKNSALFRTVSKTWDHQYFSSRSVLFLLLVMCLYKSTDSLMERHSTVQILTKASWRSTYHYFYSISKGSCFSIFLCASVDNRIFSLSQECLH